MEPELIRFRIDDHDYEMEQNATTAERAVGILKQYFPDVEILEVEEDET